MKVLIVGAGEVGFHLARRLSEENQDVILIESDPERADFAAQQLDVLTITGNGASLPVLERAGVRGARMLLAVTSQDEVNLISCLAASRMGVRYTIARISNPEYYERGSVLSREALGIDLLINPERECALETYQLLHSAAANDVAQFADGRVQLLGVVVREGAPVAGKTLAEIGAELDEFHFVTVAIVRDGQTIVPRGSDRIETGDQIYLLSPTVEVNSIPPLAGYDHQPLRRVMIAGGSAEGEYLAELLEHHGVACTILDHDRRRCLELAEHLPRALVLHADATDLELLEMEGVSGIDGFVAATGHDETNMLSSLLAKTVGARKVVSLVNKFDYLPIVPKVGIDAAVSPRMATVNAILRYVRRGRVLTVASLKGIDAEAIEFNVAASASVSGQVIRDLHLPHGSLIGTIMRGDEIIIPRGDVEIRAGDEVIVFALPDAISEIERRFA
ncbi:MAG: Trk system potassium transporter TrkA [Gemmatimonadetes bacterium]|nr:Trk system potassium transporter TrkA [Gemmatimonadota bacterium]NNF38389.1 Trk system potassium transporter TrkA [Gemmatimonadota bacterium]